MKRKTRIVKGVANGGKIVEKVWPEDEKKTSRKSRRKVFKRPLTKERGKGGGEDYLLKK